MASEPQVVEKRGRGRPKLTPEEKQARRAEREQRVADGTAGKQPTPRAPKATKPPKAEKAPKRATRSTTTDNTRTRVDDLTDDQHFALTMQHSRKLSLFEAALEKAKADLRGARDLARAELGKDALHEIKQYAELQTDAGQKKLKDQVERSARIARWAGMEVGYMEDLFSPDREPLETKMFEAGKRAGLKAEPATPPNGTTGEMEQKWLSGWHAGQKVLSGGFKKLDEPGTFGAPPPADEAGGSIQSTPLAETEPETETAPAPIAQAMTAQDYFDWGADAHSAGYGASIPGEVPDDMRDQWLLGWNSNDPGYWSHEGRIAWGQGHNGDVPETVPEAHKASWSQGWERAKLAHEENQRPTVDA